MFTKIDKKVLVVAIVILIVVLVVGFFVYKYLVLGKKDLNLNDNAIIQQQIEQTPQENNPFKVEGPNVQLQNPIIETQQKGSLMICADRCGDNICQKAGEVCPENNNLNCACAETRADCPQDCPN